MVRTSRSNAQQNWGVREYIHNVVMERLSTGQVQLNPDEVLAHLLQLLPEDDQMLFEHRATLRQLVNNHLGVSDTDLCAALNLVPSAGIADDDIQPGSQRYYIRSWTLTTEVVREIIAYWDEEDVYPSIVDVLLDFIDSNPNEAVHLRYVGMCTHPTTPLIRHRADNSERNRHGTLAEFLAALRAIDQHAYDGAAVFEFADASLGPEANRRARDLCERILIAMFASEVLLNQQLGGRYASYRPTENDRNLFLQLNTTFFGDFAHLAQQPSVAVVTRMRNWVHTIRRYAERNAEATRTDEYPLDDDAIHTIYRQAEPHMIHGHTVLVLVGSKPPVSFFVSRGTSREFLSGESQAGHLTRNFLARLQAFEQGDHDWETENMDPRAFPFINMYPWLGTTDTFNGAVRQLRQYLDATRPLITVTFSCAVTSCALSSFQRKNSILKAQYMDFVGVPSLQTFADDTWINDDSQTEPPPGTLAVVIPHFDPGRDKYGFQTIELRRLLDLCWMVTIFIAEYAMHAITLNIGDRDAICRNIIERCHPDSQQLDPRLRAVYDQLLHAKELLRQRWEEDYQTQRIRYNNMSTEMRSRIMYNTLEEHGIAEGDPGDDARQRQVRRMWKQNNRNYHIHIGRDQPEAWMNWALNVPKDHYYLQSVFHYAALNIPNLHPLFRVLRQFAPPDATDDSWMHDETSRTAALRRWGQERQLGRVGRNLSGEERRQYVSSLQKRRRLAERGKEDLFRFTETMEGREVTVEQNGTIFLRWLNGEQECKLQIRAPLRVVDELGDQRLRCRIRFLQDGIGLTNLDGSITYRAPELGVEQGIVPRNRFMNQPKGWLLEELWKRELARLQGVEDVEMEGVEIVRGREMFKSGTGVRLINEFGRVQEDDEIWPLQQWLLQKFPERGTITTAPREYVEISRNHGPYATLSIDFRRYLEQHQQQHPYYQSWCSRLDQIKVDGKHILKNIEYLRNNCEKTVVQVSRNPLLTMYRIVTFGAPKDV